jgi:DNA-binding MarR family transcriptional regulator
MNNGGVWLEPEGNATRELEAFLGRLKADANAGLYPVVAVVTRDLLDLVFARLTAPTIQILIEPDAVERAAALAVAASGLADAQRVSDVSSDSSALRLRQLSDEVSRIAATLARLSTGAAAPAAIPMVPTLHTDTPAIVADDLRAIIRARRMRAKHLPADLFADPAWDMLLDLLQAEIVQHRVPVSSLCIAAAVPATTALRWIKTMTDRGLLLRRDDPHDGRRVFIEMAPHTSSALRRFFADAGRLAVV